jgi:hypothetical protein
MNQQERSMIEGLFQRLQQAEAQAGPRDAEAEALIRELTTRQTAAPYLLAQVVLVQEQGLQQLQTRVEALEQELAERPAGGGFLGGLFGGGARPQTAAPPAPQAATGTGWNNTRFPAAAEAQGGSGSQPGAQGGGFMAGAMQTAMGVAGGVLLGNALAGLFGGEAQAAEPAAAVPEEPAAPEEGAGGGFFDGLFGGEDDEEF